MTLTELGLLVLLGMGLLWAGRRLRRTSRAATLGCLAAVAAAVVACADPAATRQRAFANANRLVEQQRFEDAIIEYRNALRADPRFGEGHYKLAAAYVAAGYPGAALGEYVRAADLLPTDDDAQLRAAESLVQARRFEEAKARVERVLMANPRHVEAHLLLANAFAGLRNFDAAVTEVRKAIEAEPQRGRAYSQLAILRLAEGRRVEAEDAFAQAIEVEPTAIEPWLALANYKASSGAAAEAEAALTRAIEIDPGHALANRVLAEFYIRTGRAALAEGLLKRIADDAKGAPGPRLALADYYLAQGRSKDAERLLEPLALQKGTAAEAQTRLALITYQYDRARAHGVLDGVLAREPANQRALMVKARWLLAERKAAEALERSRAAVAAAPASPAAHYLAGMCQVALRRHADALAAFNEVIRLSPRATAAYVQASRLYLLAGEIDHAMAMAESARSILPHDPDVLTALARGFLARGDLGHAQSVVAELLAQPLASSTAHVLDGTVRWGRRDAAGARQAYELALQIEPRSTEALAALTRIDLAEQRLAPALQRIEIRLSREHDRPELLLLAAGVHAAAGNSRRAEETLRRGLDVDPAFSAARSALANIYLAQGRHSDALQELERLAEREPQNTRAPVLAAGIAHARQDVTEAKRPDEEILRDDPREVVAANNLAWIYAEERGNLNRARALGESAVRERPDSAAANDTLGWIYHLTELSSLAIAHLEKSVALDPHNPRYRRHLALARGTVVDSCAGSGLRHSPCSTKPAQ